MALVAALVALSLSTLALPSIAPAIWVLDGVLLSACVLDFARTPSPYSLEVERTVPQRVGLSGAFRRRLVLASPRAEGLRVEVHESFPASFEVLARTLPGEPPGAAAPQLLADGTPDPSGGADVAEFQEGHVELVRTYRGSRRGGHRLGPLRVRLRGALGLVERQARFEGDQRLAVVPALLGLNRTLRLAASERWQDLGVRLLRRRGGETEFESLRDYVPGDDKRRVDWKAFARRGRPMVREYEVERGQELVLLIDKGRRMRITAAEGEHRGWTKLDWALDAALQLGAVALAKGDRVGCATFERGLSAFVAPARGGRQLARISQALFAEEPTHSEGDVGRALRELAARHRRRATVVVLSDVADPYTLVQQTRALRSGSRRHKLVFAALDDPGVRRAAQPGRPSALDRAAALELTLDRRRALRSLRASGARVLDALPAEAAAPLMAAWLEARRG